MKVKLENLEKHISCPFTGKQLWVRELDPRVYPFYKNAGYGWLFEVEKVEEPVEEIKKTKGK